MSKDVLIYTSFALVPAIIAASYWLLRIYIPKKIEAEVKHQYDLKLEGFKHKLTVTATEQNLRFAHVYGKSTEVIQLLYSTLNEFYIALNEIGSDTTPSEDFTGLLDKAFASYEKHLDYWFANQLYVPLPCETKFIAVASLCEKFFRTDTTIIQPKPGDKSITKVHRDDNPHFIRAAKAIENELSSAMAELRYECQRFLGIRFDIEDLPS